MKKKIVLWSKCILLSYLLLLLLGPQSVSSPPRGQQLLFIDPTLTQVDKLLAHLANPSVQVVWLDPQTDGVAQIAATIRNQPQFAALHILTHGAPGVLQLGATQLSKANLTAYLPALAQIGGALRDGGDILLYGCDVAEGTTGQTFVAALAQATGADIAASDDPTGAAQAGGDWALEVQTGMLNTPLAINATGQQQWSGLLPISQLGTADAAYANGDKTLELFSVDAGTDRLLLVVAASPNATSITGVTFDGVAMTQAVTVDDGYAVDTIWYLALGTAASATVGDIAVTSTGSDFFIAGIAFSGVDQTTPVDADPSANTVKQQASFNFPSANGDLVFDVIDNYRASLGTTSTAGASQSVIHRADGAITGGGNAEYATSIELATGSSTTMSWSNVSATILHVGVNINAVLAPAIVINGNGVMLTNGDTTPATADHTAFGMVEATSGSVVRTFTISNTGTGALNLTGAPLVTLSDGTHFSVNSQPGLSTIGADSSTTFQITFDPTVAGSFTTTVTLANNDSDDNPFTFVLGGTGIERVNNLLTVQGTPSTVFAVDPDATYGAQSPAGVYTITATFRNIGDCNARAASLCPTTFGRQAAVGVDLHTVYFAVKQIDHTGSDSNYLLNADGGPGQVGAQLSIADSDLPGGNDLWSQDEDLPVDFVIGLDERRSFTFKVDVYGVPEILIGATNGPAATIYLGSFVFTFDPANEAGPGGKAPRLFLPLVQRAK